MDRRPSNEDISLFIKELNNMLCFERLIIINLLTEYFNRREELKQLIIGDMKENRKNQKRCHCVSRKKSNLNQMSFGEHIFTMSSFIVIFFIKM